MWPATRAVAWIQGTGAEPALVTGQLYQTPGNFVPAFTFRYATSANPVLAWSASAESWGAPRYAVEFDGAPIDQTYGTMMRTPAPRRRRPPHVGGDGHQSGRADAPPPASPRCSSTRCPRARQSGSAAGATVGRRQTIAVTRTDPPPPGAASTAASGLASTVVRWGDGTRVQIGHTARHTFKRAAHLHGHGDRYRPRRQPDGRHPQADDQTQAQAQAEASARSPSRPRSTRPPAHRAAAGPRR